MFSQVRAGNAFKLAVLASNVDKVSREAKTEIGATEVILSPSFIRTFSCLSADFFCLPSSLLYQHLEVQRRRSILLYVHVPNPSVFKYIWSVCVCVCVCVCVHMYTGSMEYIPVDMECVER
jgi:hypothetical protein